LKSLSSSISFSGFILPQQQVFFLKDFSPDRECSGEMKDETTRVRGRWDRADSILHHAGSGIFGAERKDSSGRFESGALDPRPTSVTDEAVLAIVAAMNEFSNAALSVSPAETARMNTTAGVDAPAILSCGADLFLGRSFHP
jgi:hypothetical protein